MHAPARAAVVWRTDYPATIRKRHALFRRSASASSCCSRPGEAGCCWEMTPMEGRTRRVGSWSVSLECWHSRLRSLQLDVPQRPPFSWAHQSWALPWPSASRCCYFSSSEPLERSLSPRVTPGLPLVARETFGPPSRRVLRHWHDLSVPRNAVSRFCRVCWFCQPARIGRLARRSWLRLATAIGRGPWSGGLELTSRSARVVEQRRMRLRPRLTSTLAPLVRPLSQRAVSTPHALAPDSARARAVRASSGRREAEAVTAPIAA